MILLFYFLIILQLLLPHSGAAPDSCDCGYKDENGQIWTNQWTFMNNYQYNTNHNKNYNPRYFNKNNVHINQQEQTLEIGIRIENQQSNTVGENYPITCGAMGSKRSDMLYGSFRSSMKVSGINGTVAAMYFYHPNAEIDIEILGSVYPPQAYFAIHPGLVDEHHRASALTHTNYHLPFDPSLAFHEYRFDWFADRMDFYIDHVKVNTLTTNVPAVPGRLMFSHWTDGNPNFSQGPPKTDANLEIKYVMALFNTSTSSSSFSDIPSFDNNNNNNNNMKNAPLTCQVTQTPCSITDINNNSPTNPTDSHTSSGLNQQPFYLVLSLFFIGYLVISI
ncbi:concanavalin A-like lectin/glucanase domain-containing protein [Cunninghamella echinulata]|nr:concanavalin A-like lectin/glucanase domain-containing protein [Cunninghamella echinulata]